MIAVYAEFDSAAAKATAVVILHRLAADEKNPLGWLIIRYGDDDPGPGSNAMVIKIELQSTRIDDDTAELIRDLGRSIGADRITAEFRSIYQRAA